MIDRKTAAILKLALEFNANMISSASLVFGRNLDKKSMQKTQQYYVKMSKAYAEQLSKIVNDKNL